MRDRGTHTGTHPVHTLAKLFTAFVAVPVAVLLGGAGIAGADTPGSGQVPFSVAGPVGVGAVVVGIGGVVIGLLRRRKITKVAPANRRVPMAAKAQQAVTSALSTPMDRMDRIVADERVA